MARAGRPASDLSFWCRGAAVARQSPNKDETGKDESGTDKTGKDGPPDIPRRAAAVSRGGLKWLKNAWICVT